MNRGLTRLIAGAGVVAGLVFAPTAVAAPAVAGEFALPAGETVGTDNEIVQGPDGNMWVTTQTNSVVRVRPGGAMNAFPLAADAYGITVGPDNNLWASEGASPSAPTASSGSSARTR